MANLPSAYNELSYIESTGSQYIDTGEKYSNSIAFTLFVKGCYTTTVPTNQIMGFNGHRGDGIGTAGGSWWEAPSGSVVAYVDYALTYIKFGDFWARQVDMVQLLLVMTQIHKYLLMLD